jgi:hypothetical protein
MHNLYVTQASTAVADVLAADDVDSVFEIY